MIALYVQYALTNMVRETYIFIFLRVDFFIRFKKLGLFLFLILLYLLILPAIDDKYVMFNGCQHLFHFECILHWFERHSECPICRKQVVNEKKIREVARSIRISNRSSVLTNAGSENV